MLAHARVQVELWRADLACSVIEVNASGQVVPLSCDELNALCPSGLVLGAPLSVLLDQPLSSLLPCLAGKSLTDLFHEGALGPPPSGFAAAAPALKAAEKKGGRARAKGLSMSEMRSSPTHIIRVPHLADAADLTLSLQVVRKSGSPGYFVVLHPLAPRTSRPGLAMFLLGEPAPDAQGHAAVTDGRAEHRKRRASMEFLCSASLTRPSQPVLGSLAMTSHPLLKPSHQARASFQVPEQPPVPLHPGHLQSTVPDPPTSHGQPSRQQSLIQGDKEDVEQTLVESLAANSSKGGVTGHGTHTELEGVSRRSSLREEELDASSTSSSQAEVVTRTVSGKPSSRDAMIMAWLNGDQGPGIPQDSSAPISSPAPALASGPADSPANAPDAPVKERSSPHSQASFTKVVWRPLPAASLSAPPLPQPVLGNEASVRGGRLLQAIARGSVRAGNQMFQAGSGSMAKLRLSEVGEGKAGARARLSWEPAGVVPGADEVWARNSGGSMPSLREGAAGDQEVEELEDAEALDNDDTIGDSHYLRGKRFKKLFKLLSSDVVQQPVQRYRTHTLFLVLLLIAAHTGCFALMYTIVGTQSQLVATLGDVGTAGILATEVATFSRTLNMHYSNMTVPDGPGGPGLRLASSPEDLPYLKQLLSEHADAFYTMHQKAYAGMARAGGRLPTKDGLRNLWDADSLKGIVFTNIAVNQSLGNFSTLNLYNSTKLMGLWTAGNQLAAKARSLLQNGEAYLRTLGPSIADFMYNPDLLYIVTNGPNLVFEGYKSTMDIYMQIVISSSASANNLQLVLLAAEGGVLCLLCVAWVWLLLRAVAERRYQMYQILMVVPGGLVRRMATQRQRLGDESEDEEDERMLTAPTLTAQMAVRKSQKAPGIRFEQDAEDVEEGVVHAAGKGKAEAAAAGGVGRAGLGSCWQALLRGLGWMPVDLTTSKQGNGKGSKRQLSPSVKTSLWLIWPIAVWGPTVMLFYAIGYQLMATINGPISLFNIVSFTQLLYNDNNFFLQELTFEPNPVKMPGLRAGTVERIKELEMHYKVMLYGHESMPTAATAPYITLVSSGVTYTGSHGNYILFDTKECLASNKSECQPPSSPLYPWTHSGLDTMMSHYMEIGTSITQFQYLDPYLNGPEYNFYWNTIPDMSGGFERLSEAYQVFVNDNLRVVLSLHICLFVFTLVLMAVYVGLMVLPFVKVTRNETRRIAELVSQLPAEVDMEATLAKAQMAELLLGPAVPPPHDAIKSSKSLKKSRSLGSGSSH
ncbi:hypothetical protein V8C86DRAFT_516445 [Haematococcus lacustris]